MSVWENVEISMSNPEYAFPDCLVGCPFSHELFFLGGGRKFLEILVETLFFLFPDTKADSVSIFGHFVIFLFAA